MNPERADRIADEIAEKGVFMLRRADFLALFVACQYAGLVPVPLPLSINLGGREAYVARLRAMMSVANVSLAAG